MKKMYFFIMLVSLLTLACSNAQKKGAEASQNVELNEQGEPAEIKFDMSLAKDVLVIEDVTTEDGVRKISTSPSGVCSHQIDVEVKSGVITNVKFWGGCPGNTQGVAKLVVGLRVENAISKLLGIDCGGKGTSCPDQLAKTLMLFLKK